MSVFCRRKTDYSLCCHHYSIALDSFAGYTYVIYLLIFVVFVCVTQLFSAPRRPTLAIEVPSERSKGGS